MPIPPGDDCAGIRFNPLRTVLVTTDMLLEGVHYDISASPAKVGRKAISRAVSDIAAMAGIPRFVVIAVAFGRRETDGSSIALCRGLISGAKCENVIVVGGDITRTDGGTSICVTVLGEEGPYGSVTRSGAEKGDGVYVTGSLGGSILGKHLRFRSRWREAIAILECCSPTAMIDISDGLSTDAWHICRESGVGMELNENAIPISEAARKLSKLSGKSALSHAINDGEDYELLFTVNRHSEPKLSGLRAGCRLTRIGTIVSGQGVVLRGRAGEGRALSPGGWDPFDREMPGVK